jgi:hypothetical protein
VKPYDDERFQEAFRRARRKVELEGLEGLREQMLTLLQVGQAPVSATPSSAAPRPYLERIAVQMRWKMRVDPVEEIEYISASGVYAELHTTGSRHLIRESLQALEEQLDPAEFMRIHRSEIVRLDRVEMLLRGTGELRGAAQGWDPAVRGPVAAGGSGAAARATVTRASQLPLPPLEAVTIPSPPSSSSDATSAGACSKRPSQRTLES